MWCHHCQAEVNSIPDLAIAGNEFCPHCETTLVTAAPKSSFGVAAIPAPKSLIFDDLWKVDLDLGRARRRIQFTKSAISASKYGAISEPRQPVFGVLSETEPLQNPEADRLPIVDQPEFKPEPHRLSEQTRRKHEIDRRSNAFLLELFILAIGCFAGYGMMVGSRIVVELGLAVGSVAVVICLLLWFTEPTRSLALEKYRGEQPTSSLNRKRAA